MVAKFDSGATEFKNIKTASDAVPSYDHSVINCPVCQGDLIQKNIEALLCSECNKKYPIYRGIPFLNPDKSIKTKLNSTSYNQAHSIDTHKCDGHFKIWHDVLRSQNLRNERLLEIGCGTGLISYGLAAYSDFDSLHFSDISVEMILCTQGILPQGRNAHYFYAFDANLPPFKENTFDCVMGNSVLHHLLYYDKAIEKFHKILRPDGIAIFLEPYIVSKAYSTLIIRLMNLVDSVSASPVLSENDVAAINRLVRHATTIPSLKNDKKRLLSIEDKYIFSLDDMERAGLNAGFSSMEVYPSIIPITSNVHSFRHYVIPWLLSAGFSKNKVVHFEKVFDAFEETVEHMLRDELMTPMVFFVFRK